MSVTMLRDKLNLDVWITGAGSAMWWSEQHAPPLNPAIHTYRSGKGANDAFNHTTIRESQRYCSYDLSLWSIHGSVVLSPSARFPTSIWTAIRAGD